MYVFTENDETLVFSDMFGLTRMTFPKKTKTDRKQQGSTLFGTLSMDENCEFLYTYRPAVSKAALWQLPLLKSVKKFKDYQKTEGTLSPDGKWFIYVSGFTLSFDFYAGTDDPVEVDVTPEFEVPARHGAQMVPAPLVTGKDGRFALFMQGVLIEGRIDGDTVDVEKSTLVAVDEPGYVQLFLGEGTVYVVVSHKGTSNVYDSAAGTVKSYKSLAPAQVSNGYVAYQSDESHIVRASLATDEQEVFELAEEDRGIAHIFIGSTKLMILPWHRGEVVDVVSGDRFTRKLKEEERTVRVDIMKEAQILLRAALAVGGWVDWSDFLLKKDSLYYNHRAFIVASPGFAGKLFYSVAYNFWKEKRMGKRMIGSHGATALGVESMSYGELWGDEDFKSEIELYRQAGCSQSDLWHGVSVLKATSHLSEEAVAWFEETAP